ESASRNRSLSAVRTSSSPQSEAVPGNYWQNAPPPVIFFSLPHKTSGQLTLAPELYMHPFIETQKEWLRTDVPAFRAGDTLRVNVRVKEGDKERLQAFEGVCIARRG